MKKYDTKHLLYRAGMDSWTARKVKKNAKAAVNYFCSLCSRQFDSADLDAHHSTVSSFEIEEAGFKRAGLDRSVVRKIQYDKNNTQHQAFRKHVDLIHLHGLDGRTVKFEVACKACHQEIHGKQVD